MLAPFVKKIYTVERIPELMRKARQRLYDLDVYNVQFRPGDGWEGWPKYAPYDGIIVAAAADELPEKLLQQLAPGARMIIPVGRSGYQDLLQVTRKDDHFEEVSLGAVSFVPLVPHAVRFERRENCRLDRIPRRNTLEGERPPLR